MFVTISVFDVEMFFRVEQHSGAHTESSIFFLQNGIIHAALAAFPESIVVGEFGKSNRTIAQFVIDFHNGGASGETEKFGMRITLARKCKSSLFDAFSQALSSEFFYHDKTGIGYILFVAPAFDITESGKFIAMQSQNSLAFQNFL